jgi:hypothetical protein
MRFAVALVLLLAFLVWGGYYIMWAYQSASFSVPAAFPMKAVYETRAMLALPLGVALATLGVLLFLLVVRRRKL